ncbi:MAG: DNA polymerase III subunit beta [Patescibacteria group bacterium]|nr:DNA polymerase III subunit beta [Patescibacteria group bacterium]
MKIVCTQENLARGISLVSKSIGKDANLPVLANVLVEAKKGTIKIAATNLEIGTICLVRGKVEQEGSITIPAQLLLNYISSLPRNNVSVSVENNVVKINCGSYSGEINGISASEFPLIPKIDCEPFCDIKADLLKEALNKVVFAAARDEMRPEISGVFLNSKDGKLRLAATDSYRLGEVTTSLLKGNNKETEMVVPVTTMQELSRILDEGASSIKMFMMENQIKIVADDVILVSRLIEGQYPDYLKIIPKDFTTILEIHKSDFIKAIKTTSLFSKTDTNELKLKASSLKKEIELSAESGQVGKNIAKLACGYDGKDVSVVFNSKYLIEGLNSISSEVILMKLLGDSGPGMILGKEVKEHFYIVMPIKK